MADSAQVRITNTTTNGSGTLIPSVLSIKTSDLLNYVLSIRNECNKKYTPNRWKEFDHLPLLSVWDLADTQEEVLFTEDALPTENVLNSKGIPILIIIPEDSEEDMGINKFEVLDKETKEKVTKFIVEREPDVSATRTKLVKTKDNG